MTSHNASVSRFHDGSFSTIDLLLAVIPLSLLAGALSSALMAIPSHVGIAAGATVAAMAVGYGIVIVSDRFSTTPDSSPGVRGPPTG